MKTEEIEFAEGTTPPHGHTRGIKFSQEKGREQQAIASFVENEMTGGKTYSMSFSPTVGCSVIWISAKTDKLLKSKVDWVKKRIRALSN